MCYFPFLSAFLNYSLNTRRHVAGGGRDPGPVKHTQTTYTAADAAWYAQSGINVAKREELPVVPGRDCTRAGRSVQKNTPRLKAMKRTGRAVIILQRTYPSDAGVAHDA